MKRLAAVISLGVLLGFAALGPAMAQGTGSSVSTASEASQQVLVLLRLPAEHAQASGGYAGGYGGGGSQASRRRIAGRLAQQYGLKLETGWPMPLVGVDCYVMSVLTGRSPTEAAAELAQNPQVAWSEPMHIYRTEAASRGAARGLPNDPMYQLQPVARTWRLADLHEIATGRGVRVAVIDSGVDASHPDLAGQIQARRNFVASRPDAAEQHGTSVAGVIAAIEGNHLGIAGVAPGARLMALRACWPSATTAATVCDTLSLAKALHYAVENRAQIINLSLSGPRDTLLGRLLDTAQARGLTVVGAIDPELPLGGFPASHPSVIAVASEPGSGMMSVSAPGRDVPAPQPGGVWGLSNGSSYAAAHVSGLLALMREGKSGVLTFVTTGPGGAINACATLLKATGPCADCACNRPTRTAAIARP
jgi:hypothetical protein